MTKRKSKWQVAYDAIKDWRAPRTLRALIDLAWKIMKQYPKISVIAMEAFEISKEVEKEGIEGYLKKRKVVAGINKIAKKFNVELPTTIANAINELCTLAVKLMK